MLWLKLKYTRGIDTIYIQSDISKPDEYIDNLKQMGVNSDKILHIRSFLDHNRIFSNNIDLQYADKRDKILSNRLIFTDNVSFDKDLGIIDNKNITQDLVQYLQKWKDITKYGLWILECHNVDPIISKKYFNITESFHFDTYHRLSNQHLTTAFNFMISMAEVGLFSDTNLANIYPRNQDFIRITSNLFMPKEFKFIDSRLVDLNIYKDIKYYVMEK